MRPSPQIVALVVLAPLAPGQNDVDWVAFVRDDARLVAAPQNGLNDVEEKDYAWGDLDRDGDDDLVVARCGGWYADAPRTNVLFLNEEGVLTDRTATYAAAADVAGDDGFLTPTNAVDVVLVDVDQDGWLDVVTSPTFASSLIQKRESHPRVFMNLGADGAGSWLGLRYEDARIPDFGFALRPSMPAVAAGDVTGDGYPDLFFTNNENTVGPDLERVLLVNDGTGHFVDETAARLGSHAAAVCGPAAYLEDFDGDGRLDILVDEVNFPDTRDEVLFQDGPSEGEFVTGQVAYQGSPYHVGTGDLNRDGRPDLVICEDFDDGYLLNLSSTTGSVTWSAFETFEDVADDGFCGNAVVADLDLDGWNDVLITDVDIQIAGCTRRTHVYRNRGGTVGGSVELGEESGGGFVGAEGLTAGQLQGSHDVAVLDLDRDGDLDLVLGRCGDTGVWINQTLHGTRYCTPAVPNSTGESGHMTAAGSLDVTDNSFALRASALPPNQFGYFLTSTTEGFVPNPAGSQGNLCLGGTVRRFRQQAQSSGPSGRFEILVDLTAIPPDSVPVLPGETWHWQAWYRDQNPGSTSNFTDALRTTFE